MTEAERAAILGEVASELKMPIEDVEDEFVWDEDHILALSMFLSDLATDSLHIDPAHAGRLASLSKRLRSTLEVDLG